MINKKFILCELSYHSLDNAKEYIPSMTLSNIISDIGVASLIIFDNVSNSNFIYLDNVSILQFIPELENSIRKGFRTQSKKIIIEDDYQRFYPLEVFVEHNYIHLTHSKAKTTISLKYNLFLEDLTRVKRNYLYLIEKLLPELVKRNDFVYLKDYFLFSVPLPQLR